MGRDAGGGGQGNTPRRDSRPVFLIFLCTLGLCFLGNLPSIIVKVCPACFFGFFKFFVVVVGFCFDVDHFWSLDWMCLGGFPGGTVVKNLSAVQETHAGSIPGSGRSPAGGHGNSLQYSCLESPTDGGAWPATVHGVTKSRTQLSMHALPLLCVSVSRP